jgi:thioredoxin-related protein
MKTLLVLLSLFVTAGCTRAQDTVDTKNIQKIPPFKILRQDSTWFSAADLKKNKPVMIIYFSPDCSHCQHLMYDMKSHMKELRNVQIVMVTFTEASMLKMIQDFYKTFDLKKYPNITIGTEGHSYVVQRYYQVRMTPYIAIYGRDGKLVKAYSKVPAMSVLVSVAKGA